MQVASLKWFLPQISQSATQISRVSLLEFRKAPLALRPQELSSVSVEAAYPSLLRFAFESATEEVKLPVLPGAELVSSLHPSTPQAKSLFLFVCCTRIALNAG